MLRRAHLNVVLCCASDLGFGHQLVGNVSKPAIVFIPDNADYERDARCMTRLPLGAACRVSRRS